MALHDLYMWRSPAPDAAHFWYHPDHTEKATRYSGRGFVIAHSLDRKRAASCRIEQESCTWMFPFEEPRPIRRTSSSGGLIAPAREAAKSLGENIDKVTEEFGGKWPGRVELDVDARCAIAMLELIAQHFEDDRREGLSANDHAVIPLFGGIYTTLVDQGFSIPTCTAMRWTSGSGIFIEPVCQGVVVVLLAP